jgi:glutamate synthase (ferredoxin)
MSSGSDACGVGFIARTGGAAVDGGRDVVALGLSALRRVAHRGAPASLGAVDGCGVLTEIPWALVSAAFGRLPAGRTRALGMLFVQPSDRDAAAALVAREVSNAGGLAVEWRTVATDGAAVLPAQRASIPHILQVVVGFNESRRAVDVALYRARLRIERAARRQGLGLAIVSLSSRTVVYKGLVTPETLDRFYPDLADARFGSRVVVFHQRFSTNTTADWALAQPFRVLAHNGEINTIAGNRLWMRARLEDETALPGYRGEEPVSAAGSDSRALDDAVDLLRHAGYSTMHALSRLVPPSWERDRDLAPDVRAFYEFQSLLSEPWDGPSALVFADGRYVGAALDRNGFRPARIVRTADGLIALASEAGVLPASEHDIIERGRLGPGQMLAVDLDRGAVMGTNEIRRRLAFQRRYRRLLADVVGPLAPMSPVDAASRPSPSAADLVRLQAAFGCSREEVEVVLKPMFIDGHEAVGSMGDDAPPAVLSSRSRLFTDFFRQRFAQVTNPPVDPYRESAVMSLTTLVGAQGSYIDESAPRPRRLSLRSPLLTLAELERLRATSELRPVVVATLFDVAGGTPALGRRLHEIVAEACRAVQRGSALVIFSDRGVDGARAAMPALLAVSAAHHALIARGLRMRASLVADTGDARDAHQVAVLCAFGASAVCPWLAHDIVTACNAPDVTGCDATRARFRLAIERGLQTILSKMGVCTFSGYCGAQLYEALGLASSVVDRFFPGTPTPVGGADLESIAATIVQRHRRAFSDGQPALEHPGLHGYRRNGEYHATNPLVVRGLQRARDEGPHAYQTFTSHVYGRPPSAIRDLLAFAPGAAVDLAEVESADDICRRFFASAMSVGALSPEAHRTIARAMNQMGARSNSGEGGEESDRFVASGGVAWDGSRTKQVASARFGVTPAYLRSADELQIKIAQGSKPGEGGQLPALKVVPHIARLRHAQPGTTLISPPVHHDIYSIEDLAELIFDLRAFHPSARINVKLVSSSGIGIIAAGVAKAGADAIQISGHDGGTGASPRASIKHAGLPWEIGLADAHQSLSRAGLRRRVVLQTDGGLKTGRDIAMAAALGADEYGFGTAALVALGCVMARQCHANTCPVGIATQREDLRGAFAGTADQLVDYLRLIAGEVREILAALGLTRLDALVGRTDLLRPCADVRTPLVLDAMLALHGGGCGGESPSGAWPRASRDLQSHGLTQDRLDALTAQRPLTITGEIANTDRAFGAGIAGAIAERFGDAGLPEGSVQMAMTGSAGQSFGAFTLPGMRLGLIGDANDGLGKAMHGGEIVVAAAARERGRAGQVLVGNAALYGATGGRVFIAGSAGERFAVRNSGATAVVEGVGDHACEYMTGGLVVVLGAIGRNFGAGMTGGVAYVCDRKRTLVARTNPQHLTIEALSAADQKAVRDLLETHECATGSRLARAILRHDRGLTLFKRVSPVDATAAPAADELPPEVLSA